jgi:murein DD-endopeptidase MepM/ murein hydrolase activator NlpD
VEPRILAEAARLRTVLSSATDRTPMGPLQPPLPTAVNSNFGSRSIFNGQPRSPHAGVDFSGDVGTPILAPGSAIVALAEDLYFTGRTVILDHGQGLFSILAHLSEIGVAEGARVERGEAVGTLGATGRVTGPHLHWGVRLHGARVDPLSALSVLQAG